MNKRHKALNMLLAMLVAVSIVVMSGHNFNHVQSDLASCQLCINHDNVGKAIAAEFGFFSTLSGPAAWVQNVQSAQPAISIFYYPPTRGPPAFI